MTPSPRILIGTLVAFLIICAGLGSGFYLYAHKQAAGRQESKTAEKKTTPNFNTYDVSPPSRATTLDTKEIIINPVGNTAFVLLPKAEAENIKTGQKILLYTAENVLLETLGEVSAVTVGTDQLDGFVTVHMTLQSDDKVDATEARHGRIVLKRVPNSARLPLSALVRDDDENEPYVWTAVNNTDGTINAYRKRAQIIATTYDYFVIQPQGTDSGLYILNPDKDLEDGQTINTRRMLYAAPPEKDDFHIEALMADRRRERMARLSAEAAATKGPETSSEPAAAPGGSNSCAAPPNAAKEFMDKVQKLSPVTPTQGSLSTPSPDSLVPAALPATPR